MTLSRLAPRFSRPARLLLALTLAAAPVPLMAQDPAAAAAEASKTKYAKWDDFIKDSKPQTGYFNLFMKAGRLYMEIQTAQLEKDFLLMSSIGKGIGADWMITGMTLEEWLVTWKRVENQIQFVRRNIRNRGTPGTPMGRAVDLAYSDSVLAQCPIVTLKGSGESQADEEEKASSFLIDVTPIFISDMLGMQTLVQLGGQRYAFDPMRSSWAKVKAFPTNIELRTSLIYMAADYQDMDTVLDSRSLPITIHYSLAALPENGYQARAADDRVGHFVTAIKDFSSEDDGEGDGPFVRYVNRWHLKKADPKAKFSAPEEPIIFYLEKTIPHRYRHWIREGILEWNKAFAKLGLVDAIEVRIQSDSDDWDPEDSRYNTIRWTPGTGFAIGPSRTDPRTGQIIDADILIDSNFISGWQRSYRLYGPDPSTPTPGPAPAPGQRSTARNISAAGLPFLSPHIGPVPEPSTSMDKWFSRLPRAGICAYGTGYTHQMNLAGAHMLVTRNVTATDATVSTTATAGTTATTAVTFAEVPEEFIGGALKDLTMHEVGHTLGLRHNFIASTLHTMEGLHDEAVTREKGLVASVMDYNPINLAPPGKKQGEYFPSTIGPYDHWAIEYAYSIPPDGDESAMLTRIVTKATDPELKYATDEDVYPVNQRNLDPYVELWDIGSEPLTYAKERAEIVKIAMKALPDRVLPTGKSYNRITNAFGSLLWNYYHGGWLAAVYLGGQRLVRYHRGDAEGVLPFTPIPAEKQKEALQFLTEKMLRDPDLEFPPKLLNSLAPSYWMHWGTSTWSRPRIDFPLYQMVLAFQQNILERLLHPEVLRRIKDTELKFAEDQPAYTLPDHFEGLTTAIWSDLSRDPKQGDWTNRQPFINGFRRELQRVYAESLAAMILHPSNYSMDSTDVPTLAWMELTRIAEGTINLLKQPVKLDTYSKAHLMQMQDRIRRVLDSQAIQLGP